MTQLLYGGIEAGGTKFVCIVGSGPDDIRAETRFPTTMPEETLQQAVDFFHQQQSQHGKLAAVGVASFGPLDLHLDSPTYGHILPTPKPGWTDADVVGILRTALALPVGFETDVNAAALSESRWGAGQGVDTLLYLTIGTGVGGGALANGRLLHGLIHPEMGHIYIPHDRQADAFDGSCSFHGDCLEGLAAGPAIEKRWGRCGESIPPEHPAWALEAHYLALGLVNWISILSPERVVLGGGVMQQSQLFPLIHQEVQRLFNGYLSSPAILENIADYIVPPALKGRSGVLGALALAMDVNQQS